MRLIVNLAECVYIMQQEAGREHFVVRFVSLIVVKQGWKCLQLQKKGLKSFN